GGAPDRQWAAPAPSPAKAGGPADGHQEFGVGEPQPEQWKQALSAGDHLGILAALGQCAYRIVHRGWTDIVELDRDHAAPPLSLAPCMARQTRSGVHGIVMSLIPSGRSASTIALTTAGVEAIVPASPTPLTPSGLVVEGVSVRSVTYDGRSAADGTR